MYRIPEPFAGKGAMVIGSVNDGTTTDSDIDTHPNSPDQPCRA